MKSSLIISIFFILFFSIKSYGQELNRKGLISELKADETSLFVINGSAFSHSDSLKLDEQLNKIDKTKISEITILKNEGKISHQRNDVIIINYATKLPKKVINEKLKDAKQKFKDEYFSFSQHIKSDAQDPVLYLNGNKIHHTEPKEILNSLKSNEIAYIYFLQTQQNEEYHGQNAKNGIVIIWTNNKIRE